MTAFAFVFSVKSHTVVVIVVSHVAVCARPSNIVILVQIIGVVMMCAMVLQSMRYHAVEVVRVVQNDLIVPSISYVKTWNAAKNIAVTVKMIKNMVLENVLSAYHHFASIVGIHFVREIGTILVKVASPC